MQSFTIHVARYRRRTLALAFTRLAAHMSLNFHTCTFICVVRLLAESLSGSRLPMRRGNGRLNVAALRTTKVR